VPVVRDRWFTAAFRESEPARRILDALAQIPAEGYAACAEAVGTFDFHAELHRIAAPTLVLVGDEDPVTPPETVEALVNGIPQARLVSLPQAAHLANVEQPEAFTSALRAHLDERIPA
jgi:3-oxoadipate enol-lactonase